MLLSEIATRLGLERTGEDVRIEGVAPLESAGPDRLSFLADPRFASALESTGAGAVLVDPEHADRVAAALVSSTVKLDWARIVRLFAREQGCLRGIDAGAYVHPQAHVDASATVYPFAFIAEGAEIGPGVTVFPGCYVGEGCRIGEGCTLFPNVTLMAGTILGRRIRIHAGAVLGADGYGYVQGPAGHEKIPQIGHVEIGDDVEIGANACIDRASLEVTRIGGGTKIDNLVQIAHNVQVGGHCLLVSQVGIAGSSRLGNGVVLAGQAGVKDNVTLGDGVIIGAQGGVARDIPAGSVESGSPTMPIKDFLRASIKYSQLPELFRRVQRLEKELAALKTETEGE